jgi:hypothetical protein
MPETAMICNGCSSDPPIDTRSIFGGCANGAPRPVVATDLLEWGY